jgi:hypothetical protein
MLVSGSVLMKIADNSPQVHCDMHGQTMTCVSAKAA